MFTTLANAKTDLQKILDFSLDVICTIDAERRFVTISAAVKKLWGYDAEELIGKDCMSIVVKEEYASALNNYLLAKNNHSARSFENHIYKKNGSALGISWFAHWDAEDSVMYCVARVIENKNIEQLFLETEEQLRFAQKLAKIGSWSFNIITNKIKWSEGLYEIYGLNKEQYAQPSFEDYFQLIHPDDQEMISHELQKVIASGSSDSVHRFLKPNGTMLYLRNLSQVIKDQQGEVIGITGITQDITEQKEAEAKLIISEQKFKSLVQNGSDIIAIMDESGNFKYVSPTSLKIAGYTPEELIGKNVFQMMHPDDLSLAIEKFQEIVNDTNDHVPTQHRFLTKNGEWIWLESQGIDLRQEANIEGIVINARHITERKKLEEQLTIEQKNRERLITSAVIKAQETERSQLGQELHDNVNQVLTTIKLYNEMLLDGIGDAKDILQKSIHHLQSCINEIRSISKRLSAPTLGKISLEDSIKELVDSINLTKRLQITFSISGIEMKIIPQDLHLAVYRIVQEQLNNIIKYAEAKHVSIDIHNCDEGLFLQIADDGKGFDINAKRNGIGITNMETRAENLNGKLEIASEKNKGCKLTVKFPSISME